MNRERPSERPGRPHPLIARHIPAQLINRGVDYELRQGMVMCVEPRVTLFDQPSVGGAHLEEAVLVTDDGHEVLSHCRFEDSMLS